jgi:hypothetical protein
MRLLAPSAADPGRVGAAGCDLPISAVKAALEAGKLQMCQLLKELGESFWWAAAAAHAGHSELVLGPATTGLWRRDSGCEASPSVLDGAAEGGYAALCEVLLEKGFPCKRIARDAFSLPPPPRRLSHGGTSTTARCLLRRARPSAAALGYFLQRSLHAVPARTQHTPHARTASPVPPVPPVPLLLHKTRSRHMRAIHTRAAAAVQAALREARARPLSHRRNPARARDSQSPAST